MQLSSGNLTTADIAQGAPFTVSNGALSLDVSSPLQVSNSTLSAPSVLTTVTPSNLSGSGAIASGWSVQGSQVSGNISGDAASITGTIPHSQISDWSTATVQGSQVSGNISGDAASITGQISTGQISNWNNATSSFATSGSSATFAACSVSGPLTAFKNIVDDGLGHATFYTLYIKPSPGLVTAYDSGYSLVYANQSTTPTQFTSALFWNNTTQNYVSQNLPTGNWINLFATTVCPADHSHGMTDPILMVDQAFYVEKDFQTFGFLGSASDPQKGFGGGCVQIGQGFTGTGCPPLINLTGTLYTMWQTPQSIGSYPTSYVGSTDWWYKQSENALYQGSNKQFTSIWSPDYDTLIITRADTFKLAHLRCNLITANGYTNGSPSYSNPSRSIGTIYQNTSNQSIVVNATLGIAGVGQPFYTTAYLAVGASNPPSTTIMKASNSINSMFSVLTAVIPNGYYYSVQANQNTTFVWIDTWTEYTL